MIERTCLRCGWVAFGVSREHAEIQVKQFNDWIEAQPAETQAMYGNRRSCIEGYEFCFRCGGPHKNFRDAKPGDCPDGCTLQPIIVE